MGEKDTVGEKDGVQEAVVCQQAALETAPVVLVMKLGGQGVQDEEPEELEKVFKGQGLQKVPPVVF